MDLRESLVTALTTVLVSGGLGGWITQCYQDREAELTLTRQFRAAEYDLNKLWLQKRGDEALAARKDYVSAQHQFFEQVFTDIAATLYAADNLVEATTPAWSLDGLRGDKLKSKQDDRAKLGTDFNIAERKWKTNVQMLGIRVGYYTAGDATATKNWSRLVSATDAVLACSQQIYLAWYRANVTRTPYTSQLNACEQQNAAMTAASNDFAASIGPVTQYSWKGWDNPRELKEELGMNEPPTEPANHARADALKR